jgi:alpha-2-macroglobulin
MKSIYLCIVFFLLLACNASKPELIVVNPAFKTHISGFTSGLVKRQSNLVVQLSKPIDNKEINAQLKKGKDSIKVENLFSFSPEIEGQTYVVDTRNVIFIPDSPLPANQFYDVHFDLSNVAKVKANLEDFHYQFKTYKQNMNVSNLSIKSKDDYNVESVILEGNISTSDVTDSLLLKQTVTVTYDGKNYPIQLYPNTDEAEQSSTNYRFFAGPFLRKAEVTNLYVKWDGSAVDSKSKGTETLKVSALGDFKVETVVVKDEADQQVEITFSEPISTMQDLTGFIRIGELKNLTYSVNANTVIVFLPARQEGNFKLSVFKGTQNVKGHALLNPYSSNLTFLPPKPQLKLHGKGNILPNSQGMIFPFETISLKSVKVKITKIYETNIHNFLQVNDLDQSEQLNRFSKTISEQTIVLANEANFDPKKWTKHVLDLNTLISPDPGSIYRIALSFRKDDAICDCSEFVDEDNTTSQIAELPLQQLEVDKKENKWNASDWSAYGFDSYYYGYDGYNNGETSPCSEAYYEGVAKGRNVLASDLGMIYKIDENKLSHAYITNMITTDPMPNVEITYYDFAKNIIASGLTNAQGMLDLNLNEKPFLLIAKHQKQRGYMKLTDGKSNSISRFDVEGATVLHGINGYLYGERGVWRPGDSLYLNFVLQDPQKNIPDNYPVKFELRDPLGQIVMSKTKTTHLNRNYAFPCVTDEDAITGRYNAVVKIGNQEFSKTLRVETIKPNRLKILFDLKENQDSSKLTVKWLFGKIAKKLYTTVDLQISPMKTSFKSYDKFVFDSPLRAFRGKLDEKGERYISTKLQKTEETPGMIRLNYITRVFEEGGDFSIDRNSVPYSPFTHYIGMEDVNPDGYTELDTDKKHKIRIVSVSKDGIAANRDRVQMKLYKMQNYWWYEHNSENLSDFVSRNGIRLVKDTIISCKKGSNDFPISIPARQCGRYILVATDLESKHQTGTVLNFASSYWYSDESNKQSRETMLSLTSDKPFYSIGTNAQITFPSPEAGTALVSIENKSKVITSFWVKTMKGETSVSIPTTAEMAPNAYVHISLIQKHANTQNDLPIRLYGIIPLMVEDAKTHLTPIITMAESLKPETTADIRVNESDGKAMTYTLAIVDDGLLDLTSYKTPNPWEHFFAKTALGVKTWDMYDEVIGAYSGKLDKLLAVGGDGESENGKNPKANRFKPMVRYIGPFYLAPGASVTHKIDIPNYVGSVRVMLVGNTDVAFGSAEKTVVVKSPLMTLVTAPRVLRPQEEISLPVNLIAMESWVKDAKVLVTTNELVTILGDNSKSVTFDATGDSYAYFKLKVAEKVGVAKIKVKAISGSITASYDLEIQVTPSNPVMYETKLVELKPGDTWKEKLALNGLEGTNTASIEVSNIPSFNLEKRLNYLIQYPHGCVEQTTSAAFPQLYLSKLMNLSLDQQNKIKVNVRKAIARLQNFQTSNGGLSYWPGESEESEWGTNYAFNFLIEAEKQGYVVPANFRSNLISFQSNAAGNWSSENEPQYGSHAKESHQNLQAYRLYGLALANQADVSAMNRFREEQLFGSPKVNLAMAYSLVGQQDVAQDLVKNVATLFPVYREMSYTYGSTMRDEAIMMEASHILKREKQRNVLLEKIRLALNSGMYMSTQETAFALKSVCSIFALGKDEMSFKYSLKNDGYKDVATTKSMHQIKFSDASHGLNVPVEIKNTSKMKLYIQVSIRKIPLAGAENFAPSKDLSISVTYLKLDKSAMNIDKVQQGKSFLAMVVIKNKSKDVYMREMALSHLFPSGWEIHYGDSDEEQSTSARYKDVRDDRVYSYYDLAPGTSKIFTVELIGAYVGRYYLPSIYTEAMYDNRISSMIPGKWVSVESF